MSVRQFLEQRYWAVYLLWIVICAALFVGLRGADDPSRPGDRLDATSAGQIALDSLRRSDPQRYADYEVAHVTFAREDEVGAASRWLVLCDTRGRSSLAHAVVVELDPATAKVVRFRRADR